MRLITRAVTLRGPAQPSGTTRPQSAGTVRRVLTHRVAREHCPWCRRQPQPKQRVELPRTTLPRQLVANRFQSSVVRVSRSGDRSCNASERSQRLQKLHRDDTEPRAIPVADGWRARWPGSESATNQQPTRLPRRRRRRRAPPMPPPRSTKARGRGARPSPASHAIKHTRRVMHPAKVERVTA